MFKIQEFKNCLDLCRSQSQYSVVGVFRPLVDDVYSFTFYGIVHGHNGGTVAIKSGDDIICKAWLQYQTWHATGTCTGIVKLTGGHSVRVIGSAVTPARLTSVTPDLPATFSSKFEIENLCSHLKSS